MLYYVHKVERDKSRPQEKNLKKVLKNPWQNSKPMV